MKPFKLKLSVDPYIEVVIEAYDSLDIVTLASKCIDALKSMGYEPKVSFPMEIVENE